MEHSLESRDGILQQLARILASETFKGLERPSALLRYLVDQALAGNADRLKEYAIGVDALGRGASFDPRSDPIVRAEISRLRTRLQRYYEAEGQTDSLVIVLPKGSYAPRIETRTVSPASTPATNPSRRVWPQRLIGFGLGVGVAVSIFAVTIWGLSEDPVPPSQQQVYRFDVELPSNGELGSVVGTNLIISPDGGRVVFVSLGADGAGRLNMRRLDQSEVTELPGTEGARSPFFSPDGKWIGFWASSQLKKISIEGGLPVVLCESPDLLGASWGDDGGIIAALTRGRLWRVPSSGGAPTAIVDLASESAHPTWPQVLPGAKNILFTAIGPRGANESTIEVLSQSDGKRSVLVRGGTFGRYVNGYLTYVNQGTLFAVPFDLARMEIRGNAVPVLNDVSYAPSFGYAQVDVSPSGTLVYRRDEAGGQLVAQWLDAAGKVEPLSLKPGKYSGPRVSPDGERLALTVVESGATSIWVYDMRTNETTRFAPGDYTASVWTPDGRQLIGGGSKGIGWLSTDDLQGSHPLTHSATGQIPWSFSPDRSLLAYHAISPETGWDLWTLPMRIDASGPTAGTPEPLVKTRAIEGYPSFSPDGRWLAYLSSESGNFEIYVRAFPDNGTKVRVSETGGAFPVWSPNGHELFYRTFDQRIMITTYTVKDGLFITSKPQLWSERRLGDTGVVSNFDVSPDGKRILALMPATGSEDPPTQNRVTFVLNFLDDVRSRHRPTN